MAKKKVSKSRVHQSTPRRKSSGGWLIPVLVLGAILLGVVLHGVFASTTDDGTVIVDRGYTGPVGNFSIMYPSTWTKSESHEAGNTDDTSKDINTVTFNGNEGEVVIQWGPMGFGGGCPAEDYKDIRIKNRIVRACNGTSSDGTMYWSGISNNAADNTVVEVHAKANIPTTQNKKTIEAMLQTLQFN